MSVVHDTLRRVRDQRQRELSKVPNGPPKGPASAKGAPAWLWWAVFALFLLESALYFHELRSRTRAEHKLKQALLQLNDERGRRLDLLGERGGFEARLAALRDERNAIARAKQDVEFDNIAKEKKISEMTKRLHEFEVSK